MHTHEAIRTRRAVKGYDPSHRLSAEEERQLFELVLLAPTAFNIQHWRFVVLKDPELRKQVRAKAWDQPQVTDASLLVVVCGNLDAWKDAPRYWEGAPQQAQDMLIPAIDAYYRDKPRVQRDEVMRSAGIAAQTLMLAATAMGLQSCPMDGFDFDAVGKLIGLPDDHAIAMFVAVGKGTKQPWPRPGQLSYEEVVLENGF